MGVCGLISRVVSRGGGLIGQVVSDGWGGGLIIQVVSHGGVVL